MEYKKLSNQGFNSWISSTVIVGLVLSVCVWIILFIGLYRLNNEVNVLKAEQEEMIYKILTCHEFDFGYSPQGLADYYDYTTNDNDDEELEDDHEDDHPMNNQLSGGYHTKDGAETKRLKRDIIGTTADGIPVNLESYAESKKKNKTMEKQYYFKLHPTYNRNHPIAQPIETGSDTNQQTTDSPSTVSTSKSVTYSRRSRVMNTNSKPKYRKRLIKKPMVRSFDSNSPDQAVSPDVTIIQGVPHKIRHHHRQRRVESRPMLRPAIHMNGDVSERYPNYENYLGNGRMHHYNYHFKNWTKDVWVENLGMDDYFQLNDGYLRFLESGLYFVYAQIYYVDEHDTNGYGVYKNEDLILQCTTTTHTSHRVMKANTCYTAGVIAFSNGDVLKIRDIEANRYSIFQKGKSFFGAVKLGDIREI